jgi:hypothetical protein
MDILDIAVRLGVATLVGVLLTVLDICGHVHPVVAV